MTDPNDAVTLPLPLPDPMTQHLAALERRALVLLRAAQLADPRGCTGVALKLIKPPESISTVGANYARSYVSQAVHGLNTKPLSPLFVQSVLAAFGDGRIDCPHLKTDIAPGQCQAHAALTWGQVANTGYERLDQWRACQDCLHNPANKASPAQTQRTQPQGDTQ
jgi:hypothetical protein